MLSSVLNSELAVQVNIAIMRAFVRLREYLATHKDLARELLELQRTTDGEKPDRNRDSEFVDAAPTREAVMKDWEEGWSRVFHALEPLTEADLGRAITIRGEPHSVMQAIHRQTTHYANHVGQIVLLAKHFQGSGFRSLTIPKRA